MSRPHWSYSRLAQYLRCPLQFYFERVLRLPRPFLPSGLVLGAAVHEALADYHRALMLFRPLGTHQVGDAFLTTWRRRTTTERIQYRATETPTGLIEQGLGLIETYLNATPPTAILTVERSMTVPLFDPQGRYLDRPLVTVPDLICDDVGELTVIELKTSGRRYGQADVDLSLQATCYAFAVSTYHGRPAVVRYRVLLKNKTPQLQELDTRRTNAEFVRLCEIVRKVQRAIDSDLFYPIESPMNCSTCPYRGPCREWTGVVSEKGACHAVDERQEVAAC